MVDWYSAPCCCSTFDPTWEAVKRAMHKLCFWTAISRRWQLAEGQRAGPGMVYRYFFFLILVVCLGKRELKSKRTQAANKGSLCFAKCLARKNISNEMLLNWQLSPALRGKNSLCCSLVVSVLQILCFYTLSYRLIGPIILYLGRCLWAA